MLNSRCSCALYYHCRSSVHGLDIPFLLRSKQNVEPWEALLLNHDAEEQRNVIGLSLPAAKSQRIPAEG